MLSTTMPQTAKNKRAKLKSIKRRQALLRVDRPEYSWVRVLDEADLKYGATIVQLNTGCISDEKLGMIENALDRLESMAF